MPETIDQKYNKIEKIGEGSYGVASRNKQMCHLSIQSSFYFL